MAAAGRVDGWLVCGTRWGSRVVWTVDHGTRADRLWTQTQGAFTRTMGKWTGIERAAVRQLRAKEDAVGGEDD